MKAFRSEYRDRHWILLNLSIKSVGVTRQVHINKIKTFIRTADRKIVTKNVLS